MSKRLLDQEFVDALFKYANNLHQCNWQMPPYARRDDEVFVIGKAKILDTYSEDGAVLFHLYHPAVRQYYFKKWYHAEKYWDGVNITEDYFNSFGNIYD